MRCPRWPAYLLAAALLSSCAAPRMSTATLPKGVALAKDLKLPSDVPLAVYLPTNAQKSRFYLDRFGFWVEPGKALSEGVNSVLKTYFSQYALLDQRSEQRYGLLLDLDPKWEPKPGQVELTLGYKVWGQGDKPLLEGSKIFKTDLGDLSQGNGFYNAALRATQMVSIEVLNKLRPDAQKYVASLSSKALRPEQLANTEQPIKTGTGFYINAKGQLLTAAHVLNDCLLTKVQANGESLNGTVLASSPLLDLAVVDTGKPAKRHLPLRKGQELFLGEPVANVGYPLQGLLAATPNLTRGNISSESAMKGSVGQFQFSAPIQPGSSGGPVVSDGGELLGVTVSTLNAAKLIESGALPQNVNFALNAKYAAKFLQRHHIAYDEVPPNLKGDIRQGNAAALGSVVQLACYE